MKPISRIAVAVGALLLLGTYFYPLWKIELTAPQYPEGLVLKIWSDKIGGDVDVINGLNHYIGMGTMHTEDFIEFKILPYIIGAFIVFGLVVSLLGKRWILYMYGVLMILFGIVAIADFWVWEYNYGHNLDPNAPIQVPGMSYQPPLIGYKQLLNFGAFSIPDTGGWLFVLNDLLILGACFLEWKVVKKMAASGASAMAVAFFSFMLISFSSCSREPQEIITGVDQCDHCRMMIMDERFGGEIMLTTGKAFKFDDIACAAQFIRSDMIDESRIHEVYFVDFGSGTLLSKDEAVIFRDRAIRSPMGSNLGAWSETGADDRVMQWDNMKSLTWQEVKEKDWSISKIGEL